MHINLYIYYCILYVYIYTYMLMYVQDIYVCINSYTHTDPQTNTPARTCIHIHLLDACMIYMYV